METKQPFFPFGPWGNKKTGKIFLDFKGPTEFWKLPRTFFPFFPPFYCPKTPHVGVPPLKSLAETGQNWGGAQKKPTLGAQSRPTFFFPEKISTGVGKFRKVSNPLQTPPASGPPRGSPPRYFPPPPAPLGGAALFCWGAEFLPFF